MSKMCVTSSLLQTKLGLYNRLLVLAVDDDWHEISYAVVDIVA
jgi:hypothetical protein